MKRSSLICLFLGLIGLVYSELDSIEQYYGDDHVLEMDLWNYEEILEYVKQKQGILMVSTYTVSQYFWIHKLNFIREGDGLGAILLWFITNTSLLFGIL